MNKVWLLIVFFLGFLVLEISGQVRQTHKYELDVRNQYRTEEVVPLHYNGVLYMGRYVLPKQNAHLWNFTMLDTTLNEVWKKYYSVNARYILHDYDTLNDNLYIIFRDMHDYRQYMIFQVNIIKGNFKFISLRNFLPMYVSEFIVADKGKKILLGGYFNSRPLVIMFDVNLNTSKILPGFFNLPGIIFQLSKNERTGTIEVIIRNSINDKTNGIWLKTYTFDGEILHDTQLPYERRQGNIVNQGKTTFTDDFEFISAGTYSHGSSTYSNGLYFVAPGLDDKYGSPIYINFADLENFFSFMHPRRRERVLQRIQRRKSENKNNRFSYRVLQHNVEKVGDIFLLTGDVYSKNSSNSDRFSGTAYTIGGSLPHTSSYSYLSGFAIGFDRTGKVLWEQAIKIGNDKSYNLRRKTFVHRNDKKSILLYPVEDKLYYKIDENGRTIVPKTELQIEGRNKDERVVWRTSNSSQVTNWYDDKFLAWGSHQLRKNHDRVGLTQRKVFYINKIDYFLPSR